MPEVDTTERDAHDAGETERVDALIEVIQSRPEKEEARANIVKSKQQAIRQSLITGNPIERTLLGNQNNRGQ